METKLDIKFRLKQRRVVDRETGKSVQSTKNVLITMRVVYAGFDEPIRLTYYRGSKRIDEVKPKYDVIGTHTGRRSFICNALGMGISPNVIMKWTGHSDYKAMKPYIDVCDEIKAEAMKKFDDF